MAMAVKNDENQSGGIERHRGTRIEKQRVCALATRRGIAWRSSRAART
jgi:hypothetical protein